MLIKVAWRNIWRNKTRSLVVIFAIALGLWAGTFATAFVYGMMEGKVNTVIEYEISHLQFHHPKFRDEMVAKHYIENTEEITKDLRADEEVENFSSRLVVMGMVGSANKNGSAKIVGINTQKEAEVTQLNTRLVEGKYFEGVKRNPVMISERFAEKYKLKLRNKLVITLQDLDGEITAAAFRIVGIYKTGNGVFDDLNVFVRENDLRKLIKLEEGKVHEIAVLLKDYEKADPKASALDKKYDSVQVKPWLDLSPGMRYIMEMIDMYLYIILGIILVALLFSIVNTMLMAVLERVREIGMLMAIGMVKFKVFSMIMLETIMMCIIGAPLGILLSALFINYFGKNGIHLTTDVYEDMGFSSSIYPNLDPSKYIDVTIMVLVMAILAAIYPAIKALSLKPVEAIRKI